MAFSGKQVVIWTLVTLGYGQLAVADDTGSRIDALESLASNVDALAVVNGADLHTLEKAVSENLIENSRQHSLAGRQASNNAVGFHVRVNSTSIHIGFGHKVRFDIAVVNQGGGYNFTTHKFTCPTHGLYQFATTIPSNSKTTIDCELVMDNTHQLGRLHGNTKGHDQATQVVVVECAAGQQVWVRRIRGATDSGDLGAKYQWASFSGHLVTTL